MYMYSGEYNSEDTRWIPILKSLFLRMYVAEDFATRASIFQTHVISYLIHENYDDAMRPFCRYLSSTLMSSAALYDDPSQSLLDVLIHILRQPEIVTTLGSRKIPLALRVHFLSDIQTGIHADYNHNGDIYNRQRLYIYSVLSDLYRAEAESAVPKPTVDPDYEHQFTVELNTSMADMSMTAINKYTNDQKKLLKAISSLERVLKHNFKYDASKEISTICGYKPYRYRAINARFLQIFSQKGILERNIENATVALEQISRHEAISAAEQIRALRMAVLCHLVNPDVPRGRESVQALHANDPRMKHLDIYGVITNICDNKMLTREQISLCRAACPPIFLTPTPLTQDHISDLLRQPEGVRPPRHRVHVRHRRSYFETAMFGHQLMAISRMYETITYTRLAKMVNTTVEQVEILLGELLLSITYTQWAFVDQARGVVRFQEPKKMGVYRYRATKHWDTKISMLNMELEMIAQSVMS